MNNTKNIKSKGAKLHPSFVHQKKKGKFFQDLTSLNRNSKSIWKAINELTNENAAANSSRTKDISANELHILFSTTAEKVITVNRTESNDLFALKEFCDIQSAPPIPPMTITEVYNSLIHLKQNGTPGLDGLDGKILMLSAPVINDTLTDTELLRSGCFQADQSHSSF